VLKYKNGEIFAKVKNISAISQIPILPLPLALLQIDEG